MKKLLTLIFSVFAISLSIGQNKGIDISFLHNAEGKTWKRFDSPDGQVIHPSELESKYIFKSDGSFIFKETSNSNARELPSSSLKWSYNENNNVLSWDITSPSGAVKKYRAELTFIDDVRMVTNLSENGDEPKIVVYVID